MKIERRTSFFARKRVAIILIVTLLVVVGAIVYWWFWMRQAPVVTTDQPRPVNTVDYGPSTPQEQQDSSTAKQQAVDNPSSQPTVSGNINVTISHASQVDTKVSVRTIVSGASSGNCTMTFSLNGQSDVSKTSGITLQATTYVCSGDIDTSAFPANGDWKLSVTVTSGTDSSPAATETVTIKK